jgi:hypothetical protein
VEKFKDETGKFAKKHGGRVLRHINIERIQLLDNSALVRRLKKNLLSWCGEH